MRLPRRSRQSSVLLRHPLVAAALVLALIACPSALWYVHAHPLRHTEVCYYRNTGEGTQRVPVYEPVYCDRSAGRGW